MMDEKWNSPLPSNLHSDVCDIISSFGEHEKRIKRIVSAWHIELLAHELHIVAANFYFLLRNKSKRFHLCNNFV